MIPSKRKTRGEDTACPLQNGQDEKDIRDLGPPDVDASEKKMEPQTGCESFPTSPNFIEYRSNSLDGYILFVIDAPAMSSHRSSSSRGGSSNRRPRRSRSIKSEDPLHIEGPLDVQGSVKSGSSITFKGDIVVKDKIDAYGGISIDGNLSCE